MRHIVIFLAIGMLISLPIFIPFVHAGILTSSKVTISDSRASKVGAEHTFSFVTATAGTIASVEFEYCTTYVGSCSTPNGLTTTSGYQGTVTGLESSSSDFSTNGTITLNVTFPISISSGTTITVPYLNITNPSSINTSFFVRITTKNGAGSTIDDVTVVFATLTGTSLLVTADVNPTLSVSITPVTTGTVNGATINTSGTTASTIPFGLLYSGSWKIVAHDITVITNANIGYVVTVKSDNPPLSDGLNNLDPFTGINALPIAWSSPNGSSPNTNTGFTGYTTEDTTLCTGTANRFTSNKWAGLETSPREIICNPNGLLGSETKRIGWRAEVNGLQPAGNYTGVFIVVTTPTY